MINFKSTLNNLLLVFMLLAASRFIPHPPNFTNAIALSFFAPIVFGIKFVPLVFFAFVITDLVIGFHSSIFFTWSAILVISLISKKFSENLKRRSTGLIISLLIFFILTNFGVWLTGQYEYSLDGLIICYTLALPFFGNTIISTIVYSVVIELIIYRYFYQNKKVKIN